MFETDIEVWGKKYHVYVDFLAYRSKRLQYCARGDFDGHLLQEHGPSSESALRQLREVAEKILDD